MSPYIEISVGYGKRRRTVRIPTTLDGTAGFDEAGIPSALDAPGPIGSYDEDGFSSVSSFTNQQPALFPTGSNTPTNGDNDDSNESGDNGDNEDRNENRRPNRNGDGNNGNNGNNGNGDGNKGNNGNGNRSRSGVTDALKSVLTVFGV